MNKNNKIKISKKKLNNSNSKNQQKICDQMNKK